MAPTSRALFSLAVYSLLIFTEAFNSAANKTLEDLANTCSEFPCASEPLEDIAVNEFRGWLAEHKAKVFLIAGFAVLVAVWAVQMTMTWSKDWQPRLLRSMPRSPSKEGTAPSAKARRANVEDLHDHVEDLGVRGVTALVISQLRRDLPKNEARAAANSPVLKNDHLRLRLIDYLWGQVFIGMPLLAKIAVGLVKVAVRPFFMARGYFMPIPYDPELVVGKLLLEGISQLLHYITTHTDEDGRRIATYVWKDLPVLGENGEPEVIPLFSVHIDLDTKRMTLSTMTHADMSTENIAAQDAMVVLTFNLVFTCHVAVHGLATWGIADTAVGGVFRKIATITALYNHFGIEGTQRFYERLYQTGFTTRNFVRGIAAATAAGEEVVIPAHGHLMDLRDDSHIVDFIMRLRPWFIKQFRKHAADIPDSIECEAFFAGTVLHSLDHVLVARNIADEQWLRSERFNAMAESTLILRAAVIAGNFGVLPNVYFKNEPGPFFQAVYSFAARIDKDLADVMCICIES